MPIPPYLTTFFATLAQVSFTATGLLTVAIAVDTETRRHWFGDRTRRVFAFDHLFLILWPGFIALSGLIPPISADTIPAWPYATIIIGFIYLIVLFTSRATFRQQESRNEFHRLRDIFSNPVLIMLLYSIMLFMFSWTGYSAYKSTPSRVLENESAIAIILTTLLAHSILAATSLFRPIDVPSQQTSIPSAPIEPLLSASKAHIQSDSGKATIQTASLPVIAFLLTIASLVLGFLLNNLVLRRAK